MKELRRLVGTVVIVSFSIAALMGIAALLGAGDFGETEGRILLTTVIVGAESMAVLCYLATAETRWSLLGGLGGLVSLVAFGSALVLTWNDSGDLDELWKVFGVSLTIAASLAQASLLVAFESRRDNDILLLATLVMVTILAAMISGVILEVSDFDDTFGRALGVVAILDALGTVILLAMGAFGGRRAGTATLSTGVEKRVQALAAERGISPDQLVNEALEAYLTLR